LPTGAITDLGATPNVGLKLLPSSEFVEQLSTEYGAFYSVATIPAATYTGQDEAIDVIVVPNLLVVHQDMDEQLAYDIVRTIFEQRDQLILAHPEANNLTLENATVNSPIAYHPGAIRYYQEQGVEVQAATPAA
jgi:TRAP transporter TAXI family solute receptor